MVVSCASMPLRRLAGRIGLLALALLLAACAAPISVSRVDPQTVHQQLTRSVLSAGELSVPAQIVLNRAHLAEQFNAEPEAALQNLHAEFVSGRQGADYLFALAELSFFQAERSKDRSRAHFLAAAVYAYAFLFPPAGEKAPEGFDPRFRLACDLYNRALTGAFRSPDGARMDVRAGTFPLPFGDMEIAFDAAQLTWIDRVLTDFVPVAEMEVKGLRNRYRRAGIGAPLAASTVAGAARPGLDIPAGLKVPVTAFLRIDDPWKQLQTTRLQAALELYPIISTDAVQVGERRVPLEAEPTAALAYLLSGSRAWDTELAGFLFGDLFREMTRTQLFALKPYEPGRIPLVFVHGTASSPARWAEMFNELLNDPRLRLHYQPWFFTYETGNPVLYSAMRLREALQTALAILDPETRDPALRKMVLLGHSQGGLLTKLMVVDLEAEIRAILTPESSAGLTMSEESRDLIRRVSAVRPLPFVRRVIFLSTPHRGSYVAGNWLAHQVAQLVRIPGQLLRATGELLAQDPLLKARLEGQVGSVQAMTPGSPLVTLLAPAPLAPGVIGHSIIAVQGDGPLEQETDGVVAYSSAHLEGMASELVVRSGHSVQQSPEAIEEVRRILFEHATRP